MPYGPDRSNARPWCVLVLSENLSGPYIYSYISIMSVRIPPLLQKPRGSKKTCRKQTSRDRNETGPCSGVASSTHKRNGSKKCCHALTCSHWNRELAEAALTDPLFDQLNGKRSSSIFQHHYNYLAKVTDTAVLQNTDEDTGFISLWGRTHSSHLLFKNKHQRSFGHDILYYRYSGPMYGLYNFPSWDSRCQEMVIHNGGGAGGGWWD